MRLVLLHEKDIVLNKDRLKKILDTKGIGYSDLFDMVVKKYGIDITYKGFMNLLDNRSSWKLLYAYAILDVLSIDIYKIFDIIDVDVEQKIKDKKEWNQKYGKHKKKSK